MSYEELLKIAGSRLEDVEEAMQMISFRDLGWAGYNQINRAFSSFEKTGNMQYFEIVVGILYSVTGRKI